MAALSSENSRVLNKIGIMMTTLRGINPTMSVQVAHTLLLVAQNPNASLTELTNLSGFRLSTVSRNILDLGARNRKREPGLGLVSTSVDENELRKKQVHLTPKGELLIKQLIDIVKV